ncbi:hypothetical protein KSF_030900 [Reticulibacter mediterranei]|uniref:Uncharacterized protein n=1 Tax=Reticulibacter mediterranei TaxID=2778369 RepID=A0A8J3IKR2_9CHLR|nr:hypothetical protein [Reticulibacter mediterranei]GHO93042.1 hypothetical protein KSF_030900 [Reticulibacter mediterranei]
MSDRHCPHILNEQGETRYVEVSASYGPSDAVWGRYDINRLLVVFDAGSEVRLRRQVTGADEDEVSLTFSEFDALIDQFNDYCATHGYIPEPPDDVFSPAARPAWAGPAGSPWSQEKHLEVREIGPLSFGFVDLGKLALALFWLRLRTWLL